MFSNCNSNLTNMTINYSCIPSFKKINIEKRNYSNKKDKCKEKDKYRVQEERKKGKEKEEKKIRKFKLRNKKTEGKRGMGSKNWKYIYIFISTGYIQIAMLLR